MFNKLIALSLCIGLYQNEIQAHIVTINLPTLIDDVQHTNSQLKQDIPDMIKNTSEALRSIGVKSNIEKNLRTEILQEIQNPKNANTCIEKYREDIDKYTTALAAGYKFCVDSAIIQLENLIALGEINVMRPFEELSEELDRDGNECLKKVNTNPDCTDKILKPGQALLMTLTREAENYASEILELHPKKVPCFTNEDIKLEQELRSLKTKVKNCGR